MEVWGRELYAEIGREPCPTLLAKLLFDVIREEADWGREEAEDVNEGLRIWPFFYI
jgi:hypothetical protein